MISRYTNMSVQYVPYLNLSSQFSTTREEKNADWTETPVPLFSVGMCTVTPLVETFDTNLFDAD